MNGKFFSISAELREGWELTKVNMGFLVVYQVILYAISLFTGAYQWSWLLIPIVVLGKMGLYKSVLLMTTGEKPGFDQFYKNWPQILSWIGANILFAIMLFVGLFLLIVPGLYVLARFGLFPFFILDKNLGPLESLKEASIASEGVRWPLFLLFVVCLVLNILGVLFFGIGLLITVPVTLLALAAVYRKLTGQAETSIQPENLNI